MNVTRYSPESPKKYIATIAIIFTANLLYLTLPFAGGFAYFGDSSRHIMFMAQGVDLFHCQYLSFYLLWQVLVWLGMPTEAMLGIYPIMIHGLYVLGFIYLARSLTENSSKQFSIILLSLIPLWGLSQVSIQPMVFGLSLLPLLLASIIRNRTKSSIALFLIIAFSHPVNIIYLITVLPLRIWLSVLLIPPVIYFALVPRVQLYMMEITESLKPAGYNYGLVMVAAMMFPMLAIISIGIYSAVRNWRTSKFLMPLALSLMLAAVGLSGVFMVRDLARLFGFASVFAIATIGQYEVKSLSYTIAGSSLILGYFYLLVRYSNISYWYGGY